MIARVCDDFYGRLSVIHDLKSFGEAEVEEIKSKVRPGGLIEVEQGQPSHSYDFRLSNSERFVFYNDEIQILSPLELLAEEGD